MATTVGRTAGVEWAGKRALDFIASLLLLLVLAPLFVALAVAVLLSSPGPVLFRQQRVGLGGRPFMMLKFRTMTTGSEEALAAMPALLGQFVDGDFKIPTRSDPRVTRLGRSLRDYSLDELPQLINVLKGDMSLVGPRPVQPAQLELYGEYHDVYLSLRPGLTGLWQVSGRNSIRFPERAEIDADYQRRCGPGLDLRILAATPVAVLTRRGVQ